MKKFEHDMTIYTVEQLGRSDFVCGEDGVCGTPPDIADTGPLKALLDGHGALGWELVQLDFGRAGAVAFWRREIG